MKESHPAFDALANGDPEDLFHDMPTPAYVIMEESLKKNGKILRGVSERTGCKLLLAQKAFSNFALYPVLAEYLDGTAASGLYEARLGFERVPGKEVHVFSPAYREKDFSEILRMADHIVFNSPRQLEKFGHRVKLAGKNVGLRVNPECSTQEGSGIYDPCAPGSRLGTTREQWDAHMTKPLIRLLDGLHFHTLCEQDADALEQTWNFVEEKFGEFLHGLKWINFGGGHHITRKGYNLSLLENTIRRVQKKWDMQVYLEPGEAWALNAGYLITRVVDVMKNGNTNIAILDMSAACHAPDVIEMPYRPPLYRAGNPGEKGFTARLGGPTCLAGDIIGDYSFDAPLTEEDILVFGDMAIYTTCKNNTFNGIPLPPIYVQRTGGCREILAKFDYSDFMSRLGR